MSDDNWWSWNEIDELHSEMYIPVDIKNKYIMKKSNVVKLCGVVFLF